MNVTNVGGIAAEWNDNERKKFDARMAEALTIARGWGNDYAVVDDASCRKVFDAFIELHARFSACVVLDPALALHDDVGAQSFQLPGFDANGSPVEWPGVGSFSGTAPTSLWARIEKAERERDAFKTIAQRFAQDLANKLGGEVQLECDGVEVRVSPDNNMSTLELR